MTGRPRQTHCKRGHEFTLANTITTGSGRSCRICTNANFKIRYNADEQLRQKLAQRRRRMAQEKLATMHAVIDYTNHRGERAERTVSPICIVFGSSAWHPEPQWLLEAVDLEKGMRRFAMKDIHSWRNA